LKFIIDVAKTLRTCDPSTSEAETAAGSTVSLVPTASNQLNAALIIEGSQVGGRATA
jgi:hypothetical protein